MCALRCTILRREFKRAKANLPSLAHNRKRTRGVKRNRRKASKSCHKAKKRIQWASTTLWSRILTKTMRTIKSIKVKTKGPAATGVNHISRKREIQWSSKLRRIWRNQKVSNKLGRRGATHRMVEVTRCKTWVTSLKSTSGPSMSQL